MANKKSTTLATRYLREQASVMKKHGQHAKLSGKTYEAAVKGVARTFETIAATK